VMENFSRRLFNRLVDEGFYGRYGKERRDVFRRRMEAEGRTPPVPTVLRVGDPKDPRLDELERDLGPDEPSGPGRG
ncbi:MAG: hypothetical protein PHE83_17350, partial [Opitutaceae bacterium]|nr:hypothetical protein [Opitutaceae bacterium]